MAPEIAGVLADHLQYQIGPSDSAAAARAAHDHANGHWAAALDGLSDIDWRKTNPDWQGICMADKEVVTRMPTRQATAKYITWKLGLEAERPTTVIPDKLF